ncbi:30S ribosomal protein S17e [archaeon]|nr:30S ribosomal protein S17e [archaeon]
MGRIRTVEIRSITDKILGKYSLDSFSDKFRDNKERLKSLAEEFPSKKVLNRVAGNITRLFKDKRAEMKELLEGGPQEIEDESLS